MIIFVALVVAFVVKHPLAGDPNVKSATKVQKDKIAKTDWKNVRSKNYILKIKNFGLITFL